MRQKRCESARARRIALYKSDSHHHRVPVQVHKYLKAVEEAKSTLDVTRVVELIREHGLVREQLRTEMLNEPSVWEVMLPNMPLTALTRNLGKMSLLRSVVLVALGLLGDLPLDLGGWGRGAVFFFLFFSIFLGTCFSSSVDFF